MGATSSRRRSSSALPASSLSATLLLSEYDESRAFFQLFDDANPRLRLALYDQIDQFYVSQLSAADLSGGPGAGEWICSRNAVAAFFERLIAVADLPIRDLYLHNIDLSVCSEGRYEEARCVLKALGATVRNLHVDGVFGCERELRDLLINAVGSEEIVGLQMTNADLAPETPALVLKWIERGAWRHVEILRVSGCAFTSTFLEAVLAWWDLRGCSDRVARRMLIDLRLTSADLAAFEGKTEWIRRGRDSSSAAVIRRHGWERFELQLS